MTHPLPSFVTPEELAADEELYEEAREVLAARGVDVEEGTVLRDGHRVLWFPGAGWDLTCAAHTAAGRPCRNPVFPGQRWQFAGSPVATTESPDVFDALLSQRCTAHRDTATGRGPEVVPVLGCNI